MTDRSKVGGNVGTTAAALAAVAPHMGFIVQDLPAPVEQGRKQLHYGPTSRIEFQVHDFFKDNPITAPDVFLLRNVLHDWSDERAAAILAKLFAAMGPRTKLLIVDTIVRAPGALLASAEKRQRVLDMTMFTMMNSKERTEGDWKNLIGGVDGGVEITDVITPPGSALSMMVVVKRQAASRVWSDVCSRNNSGVIDC